MYCHGANGIIGHYHQFNHKDSEIAITCRGSTCGATVLTKPESWITGNAMVFKVKEDYCKLFFYYLCQFRGFKDVISGSGQPQITRQGFKMVELFYPEEKRNQHAIASVLACYDKLLESQLEKLEKLKEQRKALQQYLLTGIVRVKV